MDIQPLMENLKELGQMELGFGPKHPAAPNHEIAHAVATFLKQYPFLYNDESYVIFLERYAGLHLERPNDNLILDIFGFADASSNIVELEGAIIDEDGFFTFCDGIIQVGETNKLDDSRPLSFSFDTSQKRRKGVYYTTGQANYWYCESFLDWLRIVVTTRGKMGFTD